MSKVGNQPRAPAWPWGGPKEVAGKLVNRAQLEKKNVRKKGDPKNPSLASAALLDSIAPAHSAEELRLPMPPMPGGHDADVAGYADRPHLSTAAERMAEHRKAEMERSLAVVNAPPDRVDRLRSLLQREGQMLELVGKLNADMGDIERRRREEQAGEGY